MSIEILLEGWGVAALNLRGGNLSSSRERRRLLPASLIYSQFSDYA